MSNLKQMQAAYKMSRINKHEYIEEMDKIHSILFEYSDYLKDTNISKIEISQEDVIMTFRDTGMKFKCIKGDKRLAVFDTLNFGEYEKEEFEMQLKLIEPGINIFDIGGNFGWYAMQVSINRPTSNIHTFEPVPSVFNHLCDNLVLNGLHNISSYNIGFSDSDGSFNLYYDKTLSVNSSLVNLSEKKDIDVVVCKIRTLDSFIKEKKLNIDFIKCDVEGAEYFVFKGGLEVIKRDCPVIFTEMLRKWTSKFDYHPNQTIDMLNSIGYSCFVSSKGLLRKLDFVTEKTIETNYFFLHRDKHKDKIMEFVRE